MEDLAIRLNSLLKCLSAVDTDDKQALEAMPYSIQIASEYAEKLMSMILDSEVK